MGKVLDSAAALNLNWPVRRRIDDEHWDSIAKALPGRRGVRAMQDDDSTRLFVEAVLWKAHCGTYWSDLPTDYVHWHTVYIRFGRWVDEGIWRIVLRGLNHLPETQEALFRLIQSNIATKALYGHRKRMGRAGNRGKSAG